jgi:predicted dehydrogenase
MKGAAAASIPAFVPSLSRADAPSGKLSHAAIGTDGQGWGDLQAIASHPSVEVVALCDVDTARMAKAAEKFPKARQYQDWRELLEKEGDKVDSVNVTVPDHMHAPISMAAMAKGKHVYCQKPLTHDVGEARKMRLLAEKSGVVTQMGNQIQSYSEYRSAVHAIQQGVIGKIKEIYAWSGAGFPYDGRPDGSDPVPETLNWDKWLGVAPPRPFKKDIYHAFNWRGWRDFGGGGLSDFGCHILDSPFKALELTAPKSVQATVDAKWLENEGQRAENFPAWEKVEYVFPGTKYTTGEALPVTWFDGTKQPPREVFGFESDSRKIPGGGSLFIGEGGRLLLPHISFPQLVPYSLNKKEKIENLGQRDHYHTFVDACLGKASTTSHFGFAGPLTEAVLLGHIANRYPGKSLEWDTAKMEITNLAEATGFVSREYRTGW